MSKLFLALGALLAWLAILPATASVNLDRTRLILEGDERGVSIMAINSQNKPYLLQSWVETEDGEKMNGPLLALPPLQRIEPNAKTLLQVAMVGQAQDLAQDRESLFYFNVLEVPPKSDKDNVLQIAFQSRLKLFYRPKGMPKPAKMPWQAQMVIRAAGSTLTFDNPTAYHIVIAALGEAEDDSFTDFSELVVKPYSSATYTAPSMSLNPNIHLRYMDDFGGARPLTYDCGQAPCQLLMPK